MERENSLSMDGLAQHLEDMRVSLGRDPDVADLDDDGWRAVFKEGKVIELGSLGEGAGGAVTRCVLKGGQMVFALKVSPLALILLVRNVSR
jgi:mitogen-activated protein kinase kinase